MKIFFNLAIFGFSFFLLPAQSVVMVEQLKSLTISQTGAYYGNSLPPKNGTDLYKVWYTTPDVNGVTDTASGLIVVPTGIDDPMPLVIYQHGTASRNEVPSNEIGSSSAVFFASQGYISVAPDYLGMGEARGFHPYVHSETEASAGIDLIYAAIAWLDGMQVKYNGQLFITGYSQGGHAAMAALKALEEQHGNMLPVCGAAPMSGPYDLSTTQKDYALYPPTDYFAPAFLPYLVIGWKQAYPDFYDDLTEIFKPSYATIAQTFLSPQYESGGATVGSINLQLIQRLYLDVGRSNPSFMFQPDLLDELENNPDALINQYLRENDLYDWSPNTPLRMYYCTGDEQVDFRNSLVAEDRMNDLGAPNVRAVNVGNGLNHSNCVNPAFRAGIAFFDSLRNVCQTTVGIEDFAPIAPVVSVFPNPFSSRVSFDISLENNAEVRLSIYDPVGKLVARPYEGKLEGGSKTISWENAKAVTPGVYFYRLEIDGKTFKGSVNYQPSGK